MQTIHRIGSAELVFQWQVEINRNRERNCRSVLDSEVTEGRIDGRLAALAKSDTVALVLLRLNADKRTREEMNLLKEAKNLTLSVHMQANWSDEARVTLKGQVPSYQTLGTRQSAPEQVKIARTLDQPSRRLRVKGVRNGEQRDNSVCD